MKSVLVLRHAKSSWKDSDLADHDRPLNKRGKRDAPRMGKLLRDEDLVPDLIISSSARRARSTAEAVAEECGYEAEILMSEALYAAGPEAYLETLRRVSDEYARVMVVGHNPGLEELLEVLSGETESLPTAALAEISLPIQHWQELTDDVQGKLENIWRPRELT